MSSYKAQAILLISGPGFQSELESAQGITLQSLEPFALSVKETQSICMGGRIIIATLIDCDPAHLSAIEEDLRSALAPHSLDVATELL
ncbi:MAG: hypothetical protein ACKOAA_01865 [Actinomycetota bacterium]